MGRRAKDAHEAVRLRIGQGPEQDRVEHAEDGGGRPDPEGQREHGDGGEAGVLQQLAKGEAEVVHICDLRGIMRHALSPDASLMPVLTECQ